MATSDWAHKKSAHSISLNRGKIQKNTVKCLAGSRQESCEALPREADSPVALIRLEHLDLVVGVGAPDQIHQSQHSVQDLAVMLHHVCLALQTCAGTTTYRMTQHNQEYRFFKR